MLNDIRLSTSTLRYDLEATRAPTLVISARDDGCGSWPGARVVTVAKCGIIHIVLAIARKENHAVATLSISIPDVMREWVDARVRSGGYANKSDYIRDLLRRDRREWESIELALIEGEHSGISARSVTDIARLAKRRSRRAIGS
jgi:antitoxin ParD1/3/4